MHHHDIAAETVTLHSLLQDMPYMKLDTMFRALCFSWEQANMQVWCQAPKKVAALQRSSSPSQIAHAEMPAFQNCSSLGTPRRFAVAPVAIMMLCVLA